MKIAQYRIVSLQTSFKVFSSSQSLSNSLINCDSLVVAIIASRIMDRYERLWNCVNSRRAPRYGVFIVQSTADWSRVTVQERLFLLPNMGEAHTNDWRAGATPRCADESIFIPVLPKSRTRPSADRALLGRTCVSFYWLLLLHANQYPFWRAAQF